MSTQGTPKPNQNKQGKKPGKPNYMWIYGVLIALILVFGMQSLFTSNTATDITDNRLIELLDADAVEKIVVIDEGPAHIYLTTEALEEVDAEGNRVYDDVDDSRIGIGTPGPSYVLPISGKEPFKEQYDQYYVENLDKTQVTIKFEKSTNWGNLLGFIIPLLLIFGLLFYFMRRASSMGGPGGQIFNIGKSKATLFDNSSKVNITFSDVAGLDEAKEEVMEIVSFLKNPKKYTKLGGKIPKGALLIGPPGTGKTLLAKAMAGEAQVPFFSISGSDFVEMFVGVGASRVRDLFKQAREKAPCVVFIDEIDAIGRARGKTMVQGNDERENTLNQLLVEMDGFSSEKGVILLAATNRPDVLDNALLRPGRFDRQIGIDRPDLKGREQIFQVHLKPIKVSTTISSEKLAAQTPGFAGADIANVCNEAALIAARKDKSAVDMDDFNDAIDRVIGGLEKKNKIISPEEKEIIAYHEAGHAICGWYLEHAHPLVKVSIVPRGVAALGYAQYLPKEKYLQRTDELLDGMCMTLGGRAAEKVIFDKISTGAQNDLDRVTKTAYGMIAVYGMNDKIGNVSFMDMMNENSFSKPYSDETAKDIDDEARKLIDGQYQRAVQLLTDKKDQLHLLAKELLEKEVLFKDDLDRLIGKRPFEEAEKEDTQSEPEVTDNEAATEPVDGE